MKFKLITVLVGLILSQFVHAAYELYSTNVPEEAHPTAQNSMKEEEANDLKVKGYVNRKSFKYEHLNNIENTIKYHSFKSTHLTKESSDLNISSTLKVVPISLNVQVLGYEALGSFNQDTGWNGVTEIFKTEDLGVCQFSHLDLQLSGGGYSLSKDDERRDINGKYTIIRITGQKFHGFDYEVHWVDNFNWYTLTCINKEFSNTFTDKVIQLAQKIDIG